MRSPNYIVIIVLIVSNSLYIHAQHEPTDSLHKPETIYYNDYILFEGDTLMIELEEVQLLNKLRFKSAKDRNYYFWLRKKVHKAYPYAKMAQDRLNVINERLSKIKAKRKRKVYTKRLEKYFEEEFTDQLKKLTRTEGRILIKLIHRQTGTTAYDMVKDLRTGWKAFWYQKMAKMFKLSLKTEYHPESVNEDLLIEDILQRAFNDLTLERQESALHVNYIEVLSNNKKYIPVNR